MLLETTIGAIDEKRMLEDLNGSPQPYVLRVLIRRYFQVDVLLRKKAPLVPVYTSELRQVVDLWLIHRNVLERRRREAQQRQSIQKELHAIKQDEGSILEKLSHYRRAFTAWAFPQGGEAISNGQQTAREVAYRKARNKVGLLEGERKRLVARREALEKRLARQQSIGADLKSEDIIEQKISRIMGDIADDHKVVPARSLEGYAFAIVPKDPLGIPVRQPEWGSDPEPQHSDEPKENRIARHAARLVFAEMLLNEWRSRIAKCVDPSCKTPYFRLGKWRTVAKPKLCPDCRRGYEDARKQKHVEQNRHEARLKLYDFVAGQFFEELRRDPRWYRNPIVKEKIVASLNVYIRGPESSGKVKTRYPHGVTTKWILAGQGDVKNWRQIKKAVDLKASQIEAKVRRRAHAQA